jgi:hypothetical protein
MAAATSVTSYVTALGPIKVEWVTCTMAASGDTYVTKLVNARFAIANTNTAADTVQATTAVSADGKTVTVTSTDISASVVNMIIVGH